MDFRSRIEDLGHGNAILRLIGEIDLASEDRLARQLERLARSGFRAVVIDGTEVTFMDSTGYHAFIDGKRALNERGIKIILVASRTMRRVLELVSPDPIFAVRVASIEEAMPLLDEAESRSSRGAQGRSHKGRTREDLNSEPSDP